MLSSETNNMEQKINYIEVPVEAEYKLASFDKFNLLATAGGSYYILTKNSISLADTNTKSRYKLGEANNLNNTSYSANAGVKLEYNLSNKSSINLEPNYRYMINPLKNVDTKNPSLFGLNLGLSIKF
ncbi:outer membrane beta-barrel protein [uncultured Empedobacter sp.]|uniref:outer membrane beta-barrel protein n=1 Tax=uncultured Empedobacter sp. TaxID=410844 RepID=UPI00261241BC|nr:outer membrane beta-barrel protein [uncultured Empedobacter sp.]